MAYYSGFKDAFDSDSGLWTVATTNGTATLSGGKYAFDKTSGTNFDETKITRTSGATAISGDIIFAICSFDETFGTDTGVLLGQRNGGTVATAVGVEVYKTAGSVLQFIGISLGTGTDHTSTPAAFTPGQQYIFFWVVGASSYTFSVFGGSEYPTKFDLITAGSNYYTANTTTFRMGPYTTSNGCSLYAYGWCDSGGPTPSVPTTPTSSATSGTEITVGWTGVEVADFKTGTKVERSVTSGSGFSVVATIAFGTSTFGDTGLTPGVTYYYRMRDYFSFTGTDYYSAYTSETNATTINDVLLTDTFADETGITKVIPTGAVTNTSNTEVITIPASTIVYEGFYANSTVTVDEEDNLFCSFKWNENTTLYIDVGAGRGINITGDLHYMVGLRPGSALLTAGIWGSSLGTPVVASINTRYYFLMIYGSERQAVYYNTSGYSGTLADWTLLSTIPEGIADVGSAVRFLAYITGGSASTSVTVYPYTFRDNTALVIANAPIPTNLAATALTFQQINLTWTDNGAVATETSVKVERSTTGSGVGFSEIASVALGVGAYNNTGLTASTQYFYRVRSDFSFGAIHHYSSYTAEVNATTSSLASAGGISGGSYSEFFLINT